MGRFAGGAADGLLRLLIRASVSVLLRGSPKFDSCSAPAPENQKKKMCKGAAPPLSHHVSSLSAVRKKTNRKSFDAVLSTV